MIILARFRQDEVRPVLELLTDEFDVDCGFYAPFWIEPVLERTASGFAVAVGLPDRQENLARIDPLSEEDVSWLREKLPQVNFHMEIDFVDSSDNNRRKRMERPGEMPVRFDFSARTGAYMARIRSGDVDGAVEEMQALQAEQGRFPFVELCLGEAEIHRNNLEKAEELLKLEIGYRPGNFMAHCSLGYLYRVMGKPTLAREAYVESLRVYRNYMNAILSMTYLFAEPADLEILLARAVRIHSGHPGVEQVILEREMDFGGMSPQQILDMVTKRSLKIHPAKPIYLPGLTRDGMAAVDPSAGDLTREDVFRFCLEEIIRDGALADKEKEVLNQMKIVLDVTPEEYQQIFKEVQLNFRKPQVVGGDDMQEQSLYRRVLDRVVADGKISDDEKALLRKVASVLMITPDEHQKLMREAMESRGFVL